MRDLSSSLYSIIVSVAIVALLAAYTPAAFRGVVRLFRKDTGHKGQLTHKKRPDMIRFTESQNRRKPRR